MCAKASPAACQRVFVDTQAVYQMVALGLVGIDIDEYVARAGRIRKYTSVKGYESAKLKSGPAVLPHG